MRAAYQPPTDARAYRFCHRVRVRFAETDAMGVVHHAAHLLYLEEARVEFLRSVGHPFEGIRREGFELPVVEVAVSYLHALAFDEEVDVHLTVGSARAATFELGYLLAVDGQPRASAVTVHAVVGPRGRPVRCPDWLVSLASAPSRSSSPHPSD